MIEDLPLTIRMHPIPADREGRFLDFLVVARVYDIGLSASVLSMKTPALCIALVQWAYGMMRISFLFSCFSPFYFQTDYF
jgi:hypothetical protein